MNILFILAIVFFIAKAAEADSDQQAFIYARDPSILKDHEDILKVKLEEIKNEQIVMAEKQKTFEADLEAEAQREDEEELSEQVKPKKSKLILEKDDDLAWQWKYIKDVPEPPKKAVGEEASKPVIKDYDDFFNPKKPKKEFKNKGTKAPKKWRKEAKLNPKELRDPYDAGLPSVVIAYIAPAYLAKHLSSGKVNIGAKYGQDVEIDASPEDAGKFMCEDIARRMAISTEIESENQYFNEKTGACVFQVIMDLNADEVIDWLEEQSYVTSIEYNAPMDKIDPTWAGV